MKRSPRPARQSAPATRTPTRPNLGARSSGRARRAARFISPLALMQSAGLAAIGLSAALAMTSPVVASPHNGQVVAGSASVSQNGSTTTINAANNTIINHHSFNINAGQTVRFVQPSSTSRVLNRVTGPDPSTIAGTLQSNGIVYIANPAGVYFANGALVDVGGIYAAAGRISNTDFLNNLNRFTLSGAVENHGHIVGREVHLIGQRAANLGTIVAPEGLVTMSAGDEVMLGQIGGQIMARISGEGSGGDTGVNQAGDISAEGGRIALGAGDMYAMAIGHSGRSRASQITLEGGSNGVVSVSGSLDASSPSGQGGTVKVLGDKVGIFDGRINASGESGGGTVLVGGNLMGQGPEQNASAVYISPDATINADAVHRGKGGEVIVWSDEVSRIHGAISARGGQAGGDGGFVETSSARELYVSRTPDVTATRGSRGGTWLIDPEDLTIVAGGGQNNITTTPPDVFTSTGEDAELGVDLILAALTGGANVEVRTGTGGTPEGGTITLHEEADLDFINTGDNTLSLIAHRDIVLNGSIFSSGENGTDLLNLVLIADSEGTGVGSVTFNNLVDTSGGLLSISGVGMTVNEGAVIRTQGGNITADLSESIALAADLNAGTGNITFDGYLVVNDYVTLSGHDITFNQSITSNPLTTANLTINTVDEGTTRFNAAVGSPAELGLLQTNADGQTIINTSDMIARTLDFQNPVILHHNTFLRGTNTLVFGSTVRSQANQAFNLRIASPSTTFAADVGVATGGTAASARLGTFTSDAGGSVTLNGSLRAGTVTVNNEFNIAGPLINTSGDQTYNGRTFLQSDTRLEAANITFNGRVDSKVSDRALVLETGAQGITTFNAAVGNTLPLREITTSITGETVFGAGSIFTSGAQNYNNPVTVTASTTISAGGVQFHKTVDAGAEGTSLTVSPAAGTKAEFHGAVGSISPLFTFAAEADGTTHLNGGSVTTTGAQAYNNDVRLGADTVLEGSAVSFLKDLNSDTTIHSLTINTSGGGRTTFTGRVGSFSPLSTITINADEGSITRIFSSNIVTTSHQTYHNPVQFGNTTGTTVASSGGDVSFLSTIDSRDTPGDAILTVNTSGSGRTIFDGVIGGVHPLRQLTTDANGTTHIGANITTAGPMAFNDRVILTGDAILRNNGTGGITFRNSINSDSNNTPRALTLLVDPTSNATVANPSLARIIFGSDIGMSSRLRSLHLGADRTTNPTAATIVGGLTGGNPVTNFSMIINTTEGFTMGDRQKLTVLGDLTINAGTTALIGDITALRNLTINSPDIAIRTRPAGELLVRDGNSLIMRNDPTVDMVAGQAITFSTSPRLIGDHSRPAFGTPQASQISATLSEFPQRAIGSVSLDTMRLGNTYLDLRAAGPGNNNVAEAIAGAAPRLQTASSPEDAAHSQAQLDELGEMGVQTRSGDDDSTLPFLTTAVHDDASGMLASDTRVSSRRLPPGAAAEVLASYRTLFYGDSRPIKEGETPDSRAPHIASTLESAWSSYTDGVGRRADAVGFRAYVEAVPQQAEALYYMNGLRDLFGQMGYLGLTAAELRSARQEIVRSIAFPGLSPAQLESAIMATYLGAMGEPSRQLQPAAAR